MHGVGAAVGCVVGAAVGIAVGATVGKRVGERVGAGTHVPTAEVEQPESIWPAGQAQRLH